MVSLARTIESTSEDGAFYNDASSFRTADSQVLLEPVVGERSKCVGSLNTIFAASLHFILTIAVGIIVTVLAVIWPRNDKRECESYFLTLYIHVVYWVFSLILDVYFRRKHTESRIQGFLEFYKFIIKHARAPYYVTTMTNTLILTLSGVFHQEYGNMRDRCLGNLMDPLHYIAAIILLEVVIVAFLIGLYIVNIHKFNVQKNCPDAMRGEWMASFIRESYSGGEVGYREKDNHIEDLMEKQADLLRYLKEQNSRLVQKVMILSLQLQERNVASIT